MKKRYLLLTLFSIISLLSANAQNNSLSNGRITPEKLDSLSKKGLLTEENQGDFTIVYNEKHLFFRKGDTLFFSYIAEVPAVWYCDTLLFKETFLKGKINNVCSNDLFSNIRTIIYEEGIDYIVLSSLGQVKNICLPSSLKKIRIPEFLGTANMDSINLPISHKINHQFLGWVKESDDKQDEVYYSSVKYPGTYSRKFKFFGEGFYSLTFDDVLIRNQKLIDNYYLGASKIRIPDSIQSTPILRLGDNVFKNKQLSKIQFPSKLKRIGNSCFSKNKLRKIDFPRFLKSIGKNAFTANDIIKLNLPDQLDTINVNCFANNKIDSLIIPTSVKVIERGAFMRNNISYVKFNDQIRYIGVKAFIQNNFSEKNRLILPKTTIDDKTLLYWQSFKKGKYIRETKNFEEIPVAKCQPGDQMDLNLGYKAVFKEK